MAEHPGSTAGKTQGAGICTNPGTPPRPRENWHIRGGRQETRGRGRVQAGVGICCYKSILGTKHPEPYKAAVNQHMEGKATSSLRQRAKKTIRCWDIRGHYG